MRHFLIRHPINQYIFCLDLLQRNEQLFFKLLSENTAELMLIVYTPTFSEACKDFWLQVFKKPVGLFVTINEQGHVLDVLSNWMDGGVVHRNSFIIMPVYTTVYMPTPTLSKTDCASTNFVEQRVFTWREIFSKMPSHLAAIWLGLGLVGRVG